MARISNFCALKAIAFGDFELEHSDDTPLNKNSSIIFSGLSKAPTLLGFKAT